MSVKQKSQWDVVRFLTTLNTFGEIPFLGSFRWLQQWFGQNPTFAGRAIDAGTRKVAVVGAIPPDLLASIQQLPAASAIEYDVANLNSMAQLLATTDTIVLGEGLDVSRLVSELVTHPMLSSDVVLDHVFDFTQSDSDLEAWGVLDDVVMGGVSEGSFSLHFGSKKTTAEPSLYPARAAIFSGYISTDNSGGFSSVRTRNFEPPFNFAGWRGLQLWVRGDGQRYKLILRNSEAWDSPGYIHSFDTTADEWSEVRIPFESLIPTFRAKSMKNAAPFNPAKTVSIQLMLSKFEYDKQLNPKFSPGPFELAVSNISVYRHRKGVSLLVVGTQQEGEQVAQQKASLDGAGIGYRWLAADSDEAISAALS